MEIGRSKFQHGGHGPESSCSLKSGGQTFISEHCLCPHKWLTLDAQEPVPKSLRLATIIAFDILSRNDEITHECEPGDDRCVMMIEKAIKLARFNTRLVRTTLDFISGAMRKAIREINSQETDSGTGADNAA